MRGITYLDAVIVENSYKIENMYVCHKLSVMW